MPIATVQLPNGKIADIEIPQGATPQEIESFVMSQPEFAQQALETSQEPTQPQQSSNNAGVNFAKGIPQGLGNAFVGGVQASTDIGESAARLIEKLYFGDNLKMNSFGNRLAEQAKIRKEQQAQLPTSERVGIVAGEVAPFLTGGATTGARVAAATGSRFAGLAAGGATGAAEQGALSMQEQAGLGNRAIETAKSAATGAIAAPVIGKAIDVVSVVPSAAKSVVKKVLGVDPVKVKKFADAGIDPTLANVSKFRPVSQIQNLLSVTPGASSRIDRVIQHQIDNVANKTVEIVGSKGGTIEQAGTIIGEGAKSYKNMLGKRANAIYEDVYSKIPKDTNIQLDNFKRLVGEDVDFQESMVTSDFLKRKLERIKFVMNDANTGEAAPSLQRIKGIRSSIGADLNSPSLTGSERASLKKVYGALSGDLKEGVLTHAKNNYSPQEAERIYGKFNAADNVFKIQQDFIKKTITPLEKAKTPDKIYSIATSGLKTGGVQIKNILRTLNPDQTAFVRGSIINKMGKASKSAQDETGNVFSLSKFRQDFQSLSEEAKKEIFAPQQLSAYNSLIKASSEIERTGRLGRINPATANVIGWGGLTGAVISPYLSAPAAAGIVVGARITAGMMTNPKFVNWLSKQSSIRTAGGIENSIARLGAIAAASDQSTKEDILDYMSNIGRISDAKAEDMDQETKNLSEEQIRQQLLQQQKGSPALMQGIDPNTESKKIKKRYYRN